MSILKVDTLQPATGSVVHAAGHVIQYQHAKLTTATTIAAGANASVLTINFTPKFATSKLHVSYCFFNLRKTSGAGTSTWFNSRIYLDGVQQGHINGTTGYPETFSDHRYTFAAEGQLDSWSGTKAIALNCYVGSTGSTWVVSYQGAATNMTVMEIAQ